MIKNILLILLLIKSGTTNIFSFQNGIINTRKIFVPVIKQNEFRQKDNFVIGEIIDIEILDSLKEIVTVASDSFFIRERGTEKNVRFLINKKIVYNALENQKKAKLMANRKVKHGDGNVIKSNFLNGERIQLKEVKLSELYDLNFFIWNPKVKKNNRYIFIYDNKANNKKAKSFNYFAEVELYNIVPLKKNSLLNKNDDFVLKFKNELLLNLRAKTKLSSENDTLLNMILFDILAENYNDIKLVFEKNINSNVYNSYYFGKMIKSCNIGYVEKAKNDILNWNKVDIRRFLNIIHKMVECEDELESFLEFADSKNVDISNAIIQSLYKWKLKNDSTKKVLIKYLTGKRSNVRRYCFNALKLLNFNFKELPDDAYKEVEKMIKEENENIKNARLSDSLSKERQLK